MTNEYGKASDYTLSELVDLIGLDPSNPLEQYTKEEILDQCNRHVEDCYEKGEHEMYNFLIKVYEYLESILRSTQQLSTETFTTKSKSNDNTKEEKMDEDNGKKTDNNTSSSSKSNDNNDNDSKKKDDVVTNYQKPPPPPPKSTTRSQTILFDSNHRPTNSATLNPTDLITELSTDLKNVMSIRLYSLNIPFTWYAFDDSIGNTFFWVRYYNPQTQLYQVKDVSIYEGNYTTPSEFVQELNDAFGRAGIVKVSGASNPSIVQYHKSMHRLVWSLSDIVIYPDDGTDSIAAITKEENNDQATHFVFMDTTNTVQLTLQSTSTSSYVETSTTSGFQTSNTSSTSCASTQKMPTSLSNTLGWYLGFRENVVVWSDPSTTTTTSTSTSPRYYSDAPLSIQPTPYFIITLDEFASSSIPVNTLVTIQQSSRTNPLPRVPTSGGGGNNLIPPVHTTVSCNTSSTPPPNFSSFVTDENTGSYDQLPYVNQQTSSFVSFPTTTTTYFPMQTTPSQYTQPAMWSATILGNYNNNRGSTFGGNQDQSTSYFSRGNSPQNILAIIPIKYSGLSPGSYFTEFSNTLQINKRQYNSGNSSTGITIKKIHVQLKDHRGNLVNLHGNDWTSMFIVDVMVA